MIRLPFRDGGAGDGDGPGAASGAGLRGTPDGAEPTWFEAGEALWLAVQRERLLRRAVRHDGGPADGQGDAAAGGDRSERPDVAERRPPPRPGAPAATEPSQPEDVRTTPPAAAHAPFDPDPHGTPPNGTPRPSASRSGPARADRLESLLGEFGRQLALDRSRAVEKAMLPLKRRVEAPHRLRLDEEATAETAAELGVWLPRQQPAEERWLTATLLADSGDSMRLWTATAGRLRDTLHGSGAFRDVRLVHWSAPAGAARPPVPAADGRQVLLVLSDLHAGHWEDGTAPRTLARWARDLPVAVLHTLPEHVWARTGTYAERVELASPGPAAPNAAWSVVRDPFTLPPQDGWRQPAGSGTAVPLLPLSPEGLGRWARFTAGEHPGAYEVRALFASAAAPPADPRPADPPPAAVRARTLRARLSPTAYRLARLCAALPLLNLSLLRLVQTRLLPEARTWHVAELLISGLLRQIPADREVPAEARAELEIGDGLRRELLSEGTRRETALAIMLAADHIAATAEGPVGRSFSHLGRLVRDPTRAARLPVEVLQPWFSSAFPAFAAMGAPYATAMAQLSDKLSAADAARTPPPPPAVNEAETSGRGAPLGGEAEDSGFDVADSGSDGEGNMTVSGLQSAPVGPRSDGLQKPPPVWGNVPPRNRAFTGRVQLLENLHRRLQEGTTAVLPEALQGMGGVGKSQLAVEYVYRHMHEYQVIWWIPSEQPQQIRQFLVMLAGRLGLNVGSGEANTAVPAVIEALRIGEPYKNWLLVFDNAENPEAVRDFFPTNGPGRILVTSRNAQWATSARPLEVDVFTREESRSLLQLRAPMLDDETADRLAETLGDLPLGIEQAAVWLAETGMPADEYLRLFEQQANELMLSDPPPDYPLSVAAAWNVSLERLRKNHPAALQLLQACAFFAPEPISRRLFTGVRDAPVPAELRVALSDPIRLGRAIREINRYALARINHNTNTIQLHRLVQRVLINQMPGELTRQMRTGAHWLLAQGDPGEPTASHQWQQYGELLPHVLHSRAVESTDPWVRQLVLNEIQYMFSWGDHQGSLDLAEQAYHTWQNVPEGSPEQTLAAAKLFTDALRILGRYPEAFELDQRTLATMTEVLGPEHESTLEITSMLAWDYRLRGEFDRSMELDKHAYETCERLFGPNDLSTLLAAHRHALNLRFVGEFQQALELDQITHRRKVEELGENAQSTLSTLAAVVLDLQEAGEYVRARDMVEDLADRYHYNYGEMHPASMATTKMRAVAERRAGHHDAALELSGKALALFRRRYGDKYPATVNSLLAYAIDVRHSGDLDRALELGQQGVDGYRNLLGKDHPHTIAAEVNHAVCLRLVGKVEKARALDEAAHRRLTRLLGGDHPNTLACVANLVADLYELGETQASVDLAQRGLADCRRRMGEEHPVSLAMALNLSLGLRLLGREDDAEPLYTETLERYRRTLGPEHPACLAAAERKIANCDIDSLPM
ncbi:FxSxx-COOH system tetratricopeptide repeat protein [Streptomyces sp. HMX87]|uniref:FxSxx-COOH system tetratricopeptide repeat protein n=1 Tax=Streptomyces sp. HMX87 TaxID=3390849 RepID=UPI003A8816FD